MGALAGVVVSSGCRAVLGSHPDCVSLAPTACRPGPLLHLPSGFGRYSAIEGANTKTLCVRIKAGFFFAF